MTPFDDRQIQDALDRILTRSRLKPGSNPGRILAYVVQEHLAGRADRIKAVTIAQDVLGRSADFDPSNDSAVRVETKRLRDTLDVYYHTDGAQDPVRIWIPKGGYAPQFRPVQPPAPPARPLFAKSWSKPLIFASLATLLLLLVGAVTSSWTQFASSPPPRSDPPNETTVAISAVNDQAAHAYNIARQTLPRFHDLHVVKDPLDAAYVLRLEFKESMIEASLSTQDTGLLLGIAHFPDDRIGTMDQPDTQTAFRTWLGAAAQGNGLVRLDQMRRGTLQGDALCYALLLRYSQHKTSAGHLKARRCVEQRLKTADDTARNQATLAQLTIEEHLAQHNPLPGPPALDRALTAARRAMAMDPFSPHVHTALMAVLALKGDAEQARQAGRDAIQLNPFDANIIASVAFNHAILGDYRQSLFLFDKANLLQPASAPLHHYGQFLSHLGLGEDPRAAIAAQGLHGSQDPVHLIVSKLACRLQQDLKCAALYDQKLQARNIDQPATILRQHYAPDLTDRFMAYLAPATGKNSGPVSDQISGKTGSARTAASSD